MSKLQPAVIDRRYSAYVPLSVQGCEEGNALRLSLFGEQFQRLDAGVGERRSAQLQQKVGGALADDARTLIVIVLNAGGDDRAGNAQRSLPVFVKHVHFGAFFDKKLNNRVDSLVSRSVKGGPFVLTGRIDVRS